MQTKSMQEALQHVHHQQHTESHTSKDTVTKESHEEVHIQSTKHRLLPENSGQLGVSKRQSPKTQVTGSVRNHTKHKLNSFNGLVDYHLTNAMVLFVVGCMSNTLVTVVNNLTCTTIMFGIHLTLEEKGFGQKQNRNRNHCHKEQELLPSQLPLVQRFINRSRIQGNVNQSSNKVRRLAAITTSTKVERTLISRSVIPSTRVSPWSTSSISRLIAHGPNATILLVVR
mmetsp:Transcript_29777/g.43689  ORF Transcript_29777/g.43689 Transcript_29777/m.43689 type:complete len:227 (-) Transcript_29777:1415-2095(-)